MWCVSPLGPALQVLGYGPFSITGNQFSSGGTIAAPGAGGEGAAPALEKPHRPLTESALLAGDSESLALRTRRCPGLCSQRAMLPDPKVTATGK
jgi:hypothetical protein